MSTVPLGHVVRWFEDTEWSLLKVTGSDRVDFFHRLTTNRVPKAGEPLLHSFFLSVNAKVLAEFWVGAEEESLSLFVPKAQKEAAKENIDRYHFGEKIHLTEAEGCLFVVLAETSTIEELAPLSAYAAQPDPRYGQESVWFFVEAGAREAFLDKLRSFGQPLSENDIENLRLVTGRPRYGKDYTDETLFLEVAQQGDFSESKGCYPGQEIVARVLHRGRLQRFLRAFESSSQVPDEWTLTLEGKEMARVTTSVSQPDGGSRGLLYVRREIGDDGARLSSSDGEVTLTVIPRQLELPSGES